MDIIEYLYDGKVGFFLFSFIIAVIYVLQPKVQQEIYKWMRGEYNHEWSVLIAKTFDSYFGTSFLSKRFILTSVFTSFVTVIVLYFFFESNSLIVGEHGRLDNWLSFTQAIAFALIINAIPDYLSYVETRWVLGKITKLSSNNRFIKYFYYLFYLFLDLFLTATLILISINIYVYLSKGEFVSPGEVVGIYSPYALFFYSAFITSAWVWLYFMSDIVMKIYIFIYKKTNKLFYYEKHYLLIFNFILGIVFFGGAQLLYSGFGWIVSQNVNDFFCNIDSKTCKYTTKLTLDEKKKFYYLIKACRSDGAKLCEDKLQRATLDKEKIITIAKAGCDGGNDLSCFILRTNNYSYSLQYGESSNVSLKLIADNAYYNMGNRFTRLRQYEKAINAYHKAINIDPEKDEAYYNMGRAYYELKQYKEAINAYQKAIESNPNKDKAYDGMGIAYTSLKQYEKAIKAYQKAIEINPRQQHAYVNLGNAYTLLGQYDKAINAHKKAIEINPKSEAAYANIAYTYIKLGQYKEAIKVYKKAIEINPKSLYKKQLEILYHKTEENKKAQKDKN